MLDIDKLLPMDMIDEHHRVLVEGRYDKYTYGILNGVWYVQMRGGWAIPKYDVTNPTSFYMKDSPNIFLAKERELFLEPQ